MIWLARWAPVIGFRGGTAEVVPNGYWPLDFGGALGEPVTRGISARLPWLNGPDDAAASALRAAGLPGVEAIEPREAFARKWYGQPATSERKG